MTITGLKKSSSKMHPTEMFSMGCKTFEESKFNYEFKESIENKSFECYSEFGKVFMDILNEYVVIKKIFKT